MEIYIETKPYPSNWFNIVSSTQQLMSPLTSTKKKKFPFSLSVGFRVLLIWVFVLPQKIILWKVTVPKWWNEWIWRFFFFAFFCPGFCCFFFWFLQELFTAIREVMTKRVNLSFQRLWGCWRQKNFKWSVWCVVVCFWKCLLTVLKGSLYVWKKSADSEGSEVCVSKSKNDRKEKCFLFCLVQWYHTSQRIWNAKTVWSERFVTSCEENASSKVEPFESGIDESEERSSIDKGEKEIEEEEERKERNLREMRDKREKIERK